uniref:S-adenosylmethionine-dependent methyltransferase Rv2258c-like winged HTH domain-containing protein n=1 Tax=Romanomermis culicivorax TaxID=13658 RepID=A0A915JTB1_ROMCU
MTTKVQSFEEKLNTIVAHSFTGIALVNGYQMGLFEHIDSRPRSADEIALDAGCKPRYVREWLNIMVVADLVETNENGDLFWIDDQRRRVFAKDSPIMLRASFLTMIIDVKDKIKNCFKLDGPIGTKYSDYEKFYLIMNEISAKASRDNLYTKILPALPKSLKEKLSKKCAKVLKPGGVYSMVDINAHTNVVLNKPSLSAQILYTVSLFHCMPVSLGVENGCGLGTMWGKEKAEQMLKKAGFSNVNFCPLEGDVLGNYHCTSTKQC